MLYIGIDQHSKQITVCVRNQEWFQRNCLLHHSHASAVDRATFVPTKVAGLDDRIRCRAAMAHRLWGDCGLLAKRPTATTPHLQEQDPYDPGLPTSHLLAQVKPS